MSARNWWILAGGMAVSAFVCAVVPEHPIFNARGGTYVLLTFAAFASIAGFAARRAERRGTGDR